MPAPRAIAIVGGGLAGATAAGTLRAEGFDGDVVLIAAEASPPYERPPLSKGYLAGQAPFSDALVHDRSFYAEHGIELLTGRAATALDPGVRRVALDDGTSVGYDRLLLATGAVPRRPAIPGARGPGVHVLRTRADADALKAALGPGAHLAVVGGGWIGCEVAAVARGLGADVTLLHPAATPLQRVLGPRIGGFLADLHRAHGVRLRAGARAVAIEPGPRVVLADGDAVACDAVLLGTGAAPAADLAAAAGLAIDDGVACDERLETSAPGVHAAGDVAAALHPRYGGRLRVEHWANAAAQGAHAARAMLGATEPYTTVPFFFSDQYDAGLEYRGRHEPGDRLVVRGAVGVRPFQAFWLAGDGTVTAALHVDDWDAGESIGRLVERGARVDPDRLADPGAALDELALGARWR